MKLIRLGDFTPARVGLGRAGNSLRTRDLLDFQLAHARARDAVHATLDTPSLLLSGIDVASAAPDRITYLRRPDLGRKLSDESRVRLQGFAIGQCDAVFVVADGLSALAVHRHAKPLLEAVVPRLQRLGWQLAPLVIAEQARVAIGDEIGQIVNARLAIVLIGERPGLSSPDSLGVYLTWDPKPGRTDAERNCISNIRTEGLSYAAAAEKLVFLMTEARRLKLSGVMLKEFEQDKLGPGALGTS
ncbi:MAG: ethanolamine ammonia-lyase subunit EutC [Acidobacteriota bacterium]|nr:ethanolamine ammonia-lyase subunit EutC [Acidobacteriota bacterium]